MSIQVTKTDDKKASDDWKSNLPMLVESSNGLVVLALSAGPFPYFSGLSISSLDECNHGSWLADYFKPYHGKVTLENDS